MITECYNEIIMIVIFTSVSARQWMTIGLLDKNEILRDRDHRNPGAYIFEVTELISEVNMDLRGRLEAQNGQKLNRRIVSQNRKAHSPSGCLA